MVEVASALRYKQVLLDYIGLVGSVTEANVNERSPRLRPGCRVALTTMELEDLHPPSNPPVGVSPITPKRPIA